MRDIEVGRGTVNLNVTQPNEADACNIYAIYTHRCAARSEFANLFPMASNEFDTLFTISPRTTNHERTPGNTCSHAWFYVCPID